jgi:hypothetical protein
MDNRIYILYDERALEDPDQARVIATCKTLDQAINHPGDYGDLAAVYSYKRENGKLVDERFEQIIIYEEINERTPLEDGS